jgi:hypothetical protein
LSAAAAASAAKRAGNAAQAQYNSSKKKAQEAIEVVKEVYIDYKNISAAILEDIAVATAETADDIISFSMGQEVNKALHLTYAPNTEAYYYAKAAGSILGVALGIGAVKAGIDMFSNGLQLTGAGILASETGVGVGVAAGGVALTGAGVAVTTAGLNLTVRSTYNAKDNFQKAQEFKKNREGSSGGENKPDDKNVVDKKAFSEDVVDSARSKTLPNVDKVKVDSNKVTNYALDPNHPVGRNKAKVFESSLGYKQSNANQLMEQVQSKLPNSEAVLGVADQYGQRFTVDIPITGVNGNEAVVRTGWILEPGSEIPRMTTIFVK